MSTIEETREGFYLSEDGEWIPDGWTLSPLDEIGEITTGKTPAKANPHHWGTEVAFITPTDYNGCRSLKSPARRLSAEGRAAFTNQIVPAESIAVSCIGSDMGKVVFLREESLTNQQINCLSPDSGNDDLFWYYAITADYLRLRSVAEGGGSTMPILNKGEFSRLEFFHPSDVNEQKAIADVLGSLDDKIELLREQNETLEALAQTLFKRWFIDFNFPDENGNPYKESGGKMIPSELREIPVGWSVGGFEDDNFEIIMGQSPSGSSYNEDANGTLFYQGRAEFGWRYPSPRLFTTEPKRMAKENDLLMSVRAPVGDINIAMNECCIGRGLCALSHRQMSYALYQLKSMHSFFNQYNQEGTVFGSISKKDFQRNEVVVSPVTTKEKFNCIAQPIDFKIRTNTQQIQTLTNLRDTLLPKLMKGEIRIK